MGLVRSKVIAALLVLLSYFSGFLLQKGAAQTSPYYNFQDLYVSQWNGARINSLNNGQQVQLVMDASAGSGFQSKSMYQYGYFSVSMKLIPGYSAGIVTAYFLTSQGSNHDEIDFEFLGNVTGQPVILQTNVFANGVGNREQRIYLTFDPAADYHEYGIIWNHAQIIFLVDQSPIRVFKNLNAQGVPYPVQNMGAYSALFDASLWATQGGRVGVDYEYAPFIASYGAFQLDACVASAAATTACNTNPAGNWWEGAAYTSLTQAQINQIQYIQQTYMVYNYCDDLARYPTPPPECAANYS